MNAKELANKLGVHYNTVYKKIKNGEIEAKKIGKTYEVDNYIAQKMIVDKISENMHKQMNRQIGFIIGFLNEKKIEEFEMLMQSMDSFSNNFKEDSKCLKDEITSKRTEEGEIKLIINTSKRDYINQEIESQEGYYNQIQLRYELIEKIQNTIDVLKFYREEMTQEK